MMSIRQNIANLKAILQGSNNDVQASVNKTKDQNDINQEQFDQNKIMARFKNKIIKRFSKHSKNNNNYVKAINKLENIAYGYRKTFKRK